MSESCPAVSVIVPAYQVTAYIGQALDSILAQTFTDHEIIVVNDGCPDTPALESALQRYGTKIRYLRQENGGVGAARRAAGLALLPGARGGGACGASSADCAARS